MKACSVSRIYEPLILHLCFSSGELRKRKGPVWVARISFTKGALHYLTAGSAEDNTQFTINLHVCVTRKNPKTYEPILRGITFDQRHDTAGCWTCVDVVMLMYYYDVTVMFFLNRERRRDIKAPQPVVRTRISKSRNVNAASTRRDDPGGRQALWKLSVPSFVCLFVAPAWLAEIPEIAVLVL